MLAVTCLSLYVSYTMYDTYWQCGNPTEQAQVETRYAITVLQHSPVEGAFGTVQLGRMLPWNTVLLQNICSKNSS